jgi:hypothetical protein
MRRRWAALLLGVWTIAYAPAQTTPTEIVYTVANLLALRNYPFQNKADTVIQPLKARYAECQHTENWSQKTTVQWIANQEFMDRQMQSLSKRYAWLYRPLLAPYETWLPHLTPLDADGKNSSLLLGWQQDEAADALYDFLGKKNIHLLINELTEESALFHPAVDYRYFYDGKKQIDGQDLYQIAFYPEKPNRQAVTGYLYITTGANPRLIRAIYTRSNPYAPEPIRKVIWTQTFDPSGKTLCPVEKEAVFVLGGDVRKSSLLVKHKTVYAPDRAATPPVTPPDEQQQLASLIHTAEQTRAFRNLRRGLLLATSGKLPIGGPNGPLEWGPVIQSVSYNAVEGLRLRAGGNTTLQLHPHWMIGGYLAFGARDRQLKYRASLAYSLLPKERSIREFPKRLFSLSFGRDLNIPGQDPANNRRDAFFYSIIYARLYENLSLQKTASLSYEHEWKNRISLRLGAAYAYDQPVGKIQYDAITTSELQLALRCAPGEVVLQNRNTRIPLRRPRIEWNLQHRIGLKNLLGATHNYHITDFSLQKRWYFPQNTGFSNLRLSAGKVWNQVPFPLLFIPKANGSFVYANDAYNRMQIYEFVTDRFTALQLDAQWNGSPIDWLMPAGRPAPFRTIGGIKALYGPLSNAFLLNPTLPQDVHSLGQTPYIEMHIGFIFRIFRLAWVHRATYSNGGALMLGFAF